MIQDACEALVEDSIRPPRLHEPGDGDAKKNVAQRCGMEHAGIIQNDERHGLVAESVLLRFRGEIIKDLLSFLIDARLESKHVFRSKPAV